MYKAQNGLTLADAVTPWGWEIRNGGDIITALLGLPELETVAECFLIDAIDQAAKERREYADVKELAEYITEHLI